MQTSIQRTLIPDSEAIIDLRHLLHQHPELSGEEEQTAKKIVQFIAQYNPDEIITGLGGTGVAFIFYGDKEDGPTLLFRSELDAVPIAETNSLPYVSITKGVGHQCGHDGHMAILTGLASLLRTEKPKRGKVVLLFQPAEETGAGARNVLQDQNFLKLQPDYVFALHNMPGLPLHQVLVRPGTFSPASTGMLVELFGKSSHAGEPENGLNPGAAMSELILTLNTLYQEKEKFKDLTLITITHARLGDAAFGINPGFATVMATMRAFEQDDFVLLKKLSQEAVEAVSIKYNLNHSIKYMEEFPATVNRQDAVEAVRSAAEQVNLVVANAAQPVTWSEDFGHFTRAFPGALFGLGAGSYHPSLHHSDYDFPDSLIHSGASLFYSLVQQLSR